MPSLALALHTVAAVRELDRRAIAALGGDSYALMTRAAEAAWRRLRARWPEARRVRVVCGRGNNGGDGYVLARLALVAGLPVHVLHAEGESPTTEDARRARAEFLAAGGRASGPSAADEEAADLVVDAVFGIGLRRAPEGAAAALIDAVGRSAAPVLALDVPSGLDADSGHAPGVCVRAMLTVSFIAWKRGLFTGMAPDVTGERALETLGVVAAADAPEPDAALLARDAGRHALPPRRPTAHKGDFGHVLVIGGDLGYGGAARLAAEAAARAGAGLVSLATRAAHVAPVLAARPEIMVHGVEAVDALAPLLARADVVALGPGLGQGAWGRALRAALDSRRCGAPTVLDADALNLLAADPRVLAPTTVITPHPAEAARLLGSDTREVQSDRFAAARALARRYDAVVVLKGAGTVIAAPDGRCSVAPFANPALATGGSGDVLTGIVAGLLAQALPAYDAACLGVVAHGLAAERAAAGAPRGVLAGDLLSVLPRVVAG